MTVDTAITAVNTVVETSFISIFGLRYGWVAYSRWRGDAQLTPHHYINRTFGRRPAMKSVVVWQFIVHHGTPMI